MSRFAALILLAVIVCACAPVAVQETAPEPDPPPAKAQADDTGKARQDQDTDPVEPSEPATPETPQEAASEQEPTPDDGREPEAPDQPEPAQAPQAAPQDPAEPAPEPSAVEEEIAISGKITLTGGDADPREAVVYFVPENADGQAAAPQASNPKKIVTRNKALSPTVMAVPRGTEVHFPNEDPILHNLFSVSSGNDFDLGVYGPGESPSVTFEQTGVVNVYCNVHHDMHAHVLVVDTPWRTQPDGAGHFRLSDLPAGRGELHVWHRQSDRWSRAIELPTDSTFEVTLEVSKPRLPPHRDKTGQSYNRRDRDPYR